MPIGATLGAAVIGGGAAVYGANKQSKAIKNATAAETAANDRAMALQERQYGDLAPWREAGAGALKTLTQVAGGDMSAFAASPDFAFRVGEGTRAITGNAAAKGLLDSGALGKGLINYGQQAGSQEFGNWYSRIAGLAGVGQNAANQGQANANAAGVIAANQGQNLSSSYQTQGGIASGLISSLSGTAQGLIQNWPGASRTGFVANNPLSTPSYIAPNAANGNPAGFMPATTPSLFGASI